MDINTIVLNITCVSFFLLAFISLVNPANVNGVANKWFSLFLFSVGCLLLETVIYLAKQEANYSRLITFTELSRFLMAPALYLGVLRFTLPNKVFAKKESLHFIPFLLFAVYILPAMFIHGWGLHTISPLIATILSIAVYFSPKVQLLIYWILSYNKLIRHKKNIRLVTSNARPVDLNWLKYLLFGIVFLIFFWFNASFFRMPVFAAYEPLICLFGSLFICYFLLAQKEVYPYEEQELADISVIIEEDTQMKQKPTTQRFGDDQLNQHKARLINLMQSERIFLDNELSLPQLAKAMEISIHDISYLLNKGFDKNFFQFINAYRVAEAKQLMLSDKYHHLNILGIAYSAGFNSKTTFNTAFKKETGLSPGQFILQFKNGHPPFVSVDGINL